MGQNSLAQVQGHEESSFPDRTASLIDRRDPVKSAQLFPNPATDYVNLRLESGHVKNIKLTVYTIIGNTVDVETEILDDFEIRIKVRELSPGYYLIAIQNQATDVKNTYKFLKR